MHIVNALGFVGLEQPGDAPGTLSGELLIAETVIEGDERITLELMAFGYGYRQGCRCLSCHSGTLRII